MSTKTTQLSDLGAYVETYRTNKLITVSLFILLIAFVFLILPRYRLAVSANQPVTFGEKLTLSPDGIQQGQKFVPKSEIASVKHDPLNKYGFVVLRQNGKTVMHIQTRDLPNGHLFPRVLTSWVVQGVVGNG